MTGIWTEHVFSLNPDTFDIRRRSKAGCIDCKSAKVRCDEARPSCGTCARRQRVCRGYSDYGFQGKVPVKQEQQQSPIYANSNLNTEPHSNDVASVNQRDCILPTVASNGPTGNETDTVEYYNQPSCAGEAKHLDQDEKMGLLVANIPHVLQVSLNPFPRSLPAIPPGVIPEADGPTINVFFNRHPAEMVISAEFINEMKAATLLVLQDNPAAIADALYSVGSIYLKEDGQEPLLPLALDRRAKTLARLRVKNPSSELEQILTMSLALAAMEIIDTKCDAYDHTFPIITGYAARIINNYLASDLVLGPLAKYFIRTLARQDMMLSLSQCSRNAIPTRIWLDEYAQKNADKFMGYTTTLMPILEELCALAEDVGQKADIKRAIANEQEYVESASRSVTNISALSQHVNELRVGLQIWRPSIDQGVSAWTSRRLLAHAYATKSAALLMLHRMFQPAGSSVDADKEAFQMACEVLVHLNGEPDDLRLSTWPAFIASCEMHSQDDRGIVIEVFNAIYSTRKTGTAIQTRDFVINRVWQARDSGADWNWMVLSKKYPGECVPI